MFKIELSFDEYAEEWIASAYDEDDEETIEARAPNPQSACLKLAEEIKRIRQVRSDG